MWKKWHFIFPRIFFNAHKGFKANVVMWNIFFNSPLYKIKRGHRIKYIYRLMDIFFHISTNGLKPLTINKTCVGKSKTKIPHKNSDSPQSP